MGLQVGQGCTVGDCGNVLKDGPGDESREVQDHGLHTRVHTGEVGGACVKETGKGIRSNV